MLVLSHHESKSPTSDLSADIDVSSWATCLRAGRGCLRRGVSAGRSVRLAQTEYRLGQFLVLVSKAQIFGPSVRLGVRRAPCDFEIRITGIESNNQRIHSCSLTQW